MAHKRRTSSVLVESVEYSVNATPFFNPAVTVCVLAGDVSIALSPVLSRSAQRETMRAAFLVGLHDFRCVAFKRLPSRSLFDGYGKR